VKILISISTVEEQLRLRGMEINQDEETLEEVPHQDGEELKVRPVEQDGIIAEDFD
jgi:hypothetical protein